MTKILWALGGYTIAVVLAFLTVATWLDKQNAEEAARKREQIWKAKYAEAATSVKADSIEVVKRVTVTKTLRDTLNIHDTLQVIEYLHQTDTLRLACTACTESASRLKVTADSSIAFWKGRYESVKPSWRDRLGVTVGYGVSKAGSDVKVGPQVGISVRVYP
jgi:hypothetical protein